MVVALGQLHYHAFGPAKLSLNAFVVPFSATFKAKVAAVLGEKTLAELAQQYDVHPNRIQDWRGRLVGSAERLFERRAGRDNDTEHQVKELHAEIGQLTMERDFLSGKLDHRAARGARP